jgi:hypothetical protein
MLHPYSKKMLIFRFVISNPSVSLLDTKYFYFKRKKGLLDFVIKENLALRAK